MLERFCRMKVYRKLEPICCNSLVHLKGQKPKLNEFRNFMVYSDAFEVWDGAMAKRLIRAKPEAAIRSAVKYFEDKAEVLFARFIIDCYNGDLKQAMRETESFDDLYKRFEQHFDERRKAFMDETNNLIEARKSELKEVKRSPQSHGGVANLLKVLTRTMEQQGSTIRSIAKVQYTVCMQAGIYIPEEFITDVLVAAKMEDEAIEQATS